MPIAWPEPRVGERTVQSAWQAGLLLVLAAAATATAFWRPAAPTGLGLVLGLIACSLSLWAFTASRDAAAVALVFVTYARLSEVLVAQQRPSINKFLVPLLALAVAYHWCVRGERPAQWRLPAALVGAYGLSCLISIAVATDLPAATATFVAFVKNGVIAVLLVMLVQTAPAWRRAVWALLGAGALTATLTVVQRITGDFATTYLGLAQVRVLHIVGAYDSFRSVGPVGNPNFYGQTLVVLIPLAIDRLWFETSRRARVAAGYTLAVCTLAVVFTFSRGAFLGLVVVAVAMLFRQEPRPVVRLATVAGLMVLTALPSSHHRQRMATILHANQLAYRATYSPVSPTPASGAIQVARGQRKPDDVDYSMRRRVSEVLSALLMFRDHPLVGVGVGNAPLHYPRYSQKLGLEPGKEPRAPHNLYAEVLAETGLIGGISFGALLFFAFRSLLLARRSFVAVGLPTYGHLALSLGVSWVGYLTCAVFEHGAYPRYFWLLTGLAFAVRPAAVAELAVRALPDRAGAASPPAGTP